MPRIIDFSTVSDRKVMQVYPKGWVTPLLVEYGILQVNDYDPGLSLVWRVVGTTHTWVILEQRINVLSGADYRKHFENALENFRGLLLRWMDDDDYRGLGWVNEYAGQYGSYMIDSNGSTLLSQRGVDDTLESKIRNSKIKIEDI